MSLELETTSESGANGAPELGEDALVAFETLAPLYDRFTHEDNYSLWGGLLAQILETWEAPGRSLLDVACGTGKSALALADHGYTVTGCDLSPAMLEQAIAKKTSIPFFMADMRYLPDSPTGFDVVNCMDDAVNFLLTEEDLRLAFSSAANALRPGGLYVFDCNTLRNYRGWYSQTEVVDGEDVVFAWVGRTSTDHPSGGLANAQLLIFQRADDGHWIRSDSPHTQRHFPVSQVEESLRAAGLEPLAAYGLDRGVLHERVDEQRDGKAIHVARRLPQ